MKLVFRKPALLASGLVCLSYFSFAALAQTRSEGAAKPALWYSSVYPRLSDRAFPVKKPGECFCDADCLAHLNEHNRQTVQSWRPAYLDRDESRVNDPEGLEKLLQRDATVSSWRSANYRDEIRAIDLDGLKKLLQRDGKDARPLLLNFWATWCDPCREEFPDLVKLDGDYQNKGLNFIAISLDDVTDIKSEVPKFLNQMKATMPVVLLDVKDPEPAIKVVDPTWDGQLPATFLYDKDGKIVFKHFGKIKPDELRTAIDKQISSKR